MKFARFHLSTLLLLCVFCGACVGVWLAPAVWQPWNSVQIEGAENRPRQQDDPDMAMAFDSTGKRLFVSVKDEGYLIDLATRKVLWKRPFYTWHYCDATSRFVEGDSVIEMNLIKDLDASVVELKGEHYLSAADGSDVPSPTTAGTRQPDYYTVHSTTDPYASYVRSQNRWYSNQVQREKRTVTNGISPDGLELCDGLGLWHLSGHAKGGLIYALPSKEGSAAAFSPDGLWLATDTRDGVAIWRRTREYGRSGFLKLPVFWVAVVSLLGLMALFVRWISRQRTVYSAQLMQQDDSRIKGSAN